MALLATQHLSLSAGYKVLCQDLDWQCQAGEIWAVLGCNGSGKSTLLHALAGLPTAGQIHCNGTVLLNEQIMTAVPRRSIAQQLGLLLQEYHEPFPGTVLEYVLMGRHPHLHAWQWESAEDYARTSTALELVGLNGFEQRDIQSLSGGEFQRMRIAMILVQDPQILLLDEPTNHLDLQYQHAILETLTKTVAAASKAIVMTLHDINLALRYCSHAMLLTDSGQPICGTCNEVMTEQNLSELYRYSLKHMTHNGRDLFFPA